MCKSQSQQHQYRKRVRAIEQNESETDLFIGTVRMEHEKHIGMMASAETEHEDEKWTEKLKINQKRVTFKLDTGAECNAMSVQTLNALDVKGRLRVSKSKLVAFFGQKVTPLGRRALTRVYKGQKHQIEFEIIQNVPAVLGGSTCLKLGLV